MVAASTLNGVDGSSAQSRIYLCCIWVHGDHYRTWYFRLGMTSMIWPLLSCVFTFSNKARDYASSSSKLVFSIVMYALVCSPCFAMKFATRDGRMWALNVGLVFIVWTLNLSIWIGAQDSMRNVINSLSQLWGYAVDTNSNTKQFGHP